MKYFLIIYIAMICNSLMAKELSLPDLKSMARQYNLGVQAERFSVEAHKDNVNLSKSKFYPKLGVQLGQEKIKSDTTDENGTQAFVYGEVNLFNGYADQRELGQSHIGLKISQSKLRQAEFDLDKEIEKLYFQYLFIAKKLKVTNEAISRNAHQRKWVKKRYSSSLVTETDLMEFKLKHSRLKSQAVFLKLKLDQVYEFLLVQIGEETSQKPSIIGELPHLVLAENYGQLEVSLNESEAIKRSSLHVQEANNNVQLAKSGWLPKLDLELKHGRLDELETGLDDSVTSSKVGLVFNWNFSTGLETQHRVAHNRNHLKRDEYSHRQKLRDNKSQLKGSFRKLKILESTILSEEENESLAKVFYQKTIKEYRKGIKDAGALSSASDELTDVTHRIFELKSEYLVTKIELERALSREVKFEYYGHHKE